MPPASSPTLRQRRLGGELRKLRDRAGLSTNQAAVLLGVNQSRISNIEAGRYAVGQERVRTIARNYACSDGALVDALAGMTGGRTRGWWEEYREQVPTGLLDLAELEHHATAVRVAQAIHIPGLLQTTDHARALFGNAVPALLPHDAEYRLSFRIKRQAILYREPTVAYTAIIHEAALRTHVGDSSTVKNQLNHLAESSRRNNVTILVIPFVRGPFPGSGHGIDYACGPVPQLDTVQLDTEHGSEFLDAEAQLERYRTVLDRLEGLALSPEESRDFIHGLANDV